MPLVLATVADSSPSDDEQTGIHSLPNELLLIIFSMSDHCKTIGMIGQVSRLWNVLAQTPVLQLHPKFALEIRFAKYNTHQIDPDTMVSCDSSVGVLASDTVTGQVYVANGKQISVMAATGELVRTLDGHTDVVRALAVGPTGLLYSGSSDKTIKIWTPQGECISPQMGHTATVRALAVSPDGSRLYSGGHDKLVRIWQLDKKGIPDNDAAGVKVITGHNSGVYAIAVAADGKTFYSGAGSKDSKIRVWTADGELLSQRAGHAGGIYSLCVDAHGNLFSGSADKMIMMWSAVGDLVRKFRGHRLAVNAISVRENRLYTASADKSIRVWDVETGHQIRTFLKHSNAVNSLALAANGRIYSGSQDKAVMLW